MYRIQALFATAALLVGQAQADEGRVDAGWRFQAGLTLVSGVSDLLDKIETNNPTMDARQRVPGGLALAARREWSNGVGVGVTLGPLLLARGDASFRIVPVGVDVRYRIADAGKGKTYVRAGIEKMSAGGDFIETGTAGGTLALGYESTAGGRPGWGAEFSIRSAKVVVSATPAHAAQDALPARAAVAVFYVF